MKIQNPFFLFVCLSVESPTNFFAIESYRKNLISKLQVKNLAGLTKHAIKMGLLDS